MISEDFIMDRRNLLESGFALACSLGLGAMIGYQYREAKPITMQPHEVLDFHGKAYTGNIFIVNNSKKNLLIKNLDVVGTLYVSHAVDSYDKLPTIFYKDSSFTCPGKYSLSHKNSDWTSVTQDFFRTTLDPSPITISYYDFMGDCKYTLYHEISNP